MVFKERFTSKLFIEFMRRLVRQADGRKIFLILDGHPVYHAERGKQWVAKRQDHIELIILPSYSPDLNPDKLLNQDVKSNVVGRWRAKDQAELMADVRGYNAKHATPTANCPKLFSASRRPIGSVSQWEEDVFSLFVPEY